MYRSQCFLRSALRKDGVNAGVFNPLQEEPPLTRRSRDKSDVTALCNVVCTQNHQLGVFRRRART